MLEPFHTKGCVEAGCDEAGRGCMAGPVVAAAVILPVGYANPLLNDSKKLSEKERNLLRSDIEKNALAYAVSAVSHEEIDEINILNASILGMHRALDQLKVPFDHILVDGNKFKPYKNVRATTVVKGDGIYASIAAASILAKTFRDEFMERISVEHPLYRWEKNKGYPTNEHREAILAFGLTQYHRKSFHLKPVQLKMF
ncbi:MAG: ribonuclease HII [Bacteroidetes bacterium]|nr:ribonuclease HII [Bacteroidota bacterium]MBU1720987.1 ribonuclease HII [Bacteroidota bacterium]